MTGNEQDGKRDPDGGSGGNGQMNEANDGQVNHGHVIMNDIAGGSNGVAISSSNANVNTKPTAQLRISRKGVRPMSQEEVLSRKSDSASKGQTVASKTAAKTSASSARDAAASEMTPTDMPGTATPTKINPWVTTK